MSTQDTNAEQRQGITELPANAWNRSLCYLVRALRDRLSRQPKHVCGDCAYWLDVSTDDHLCELLAALTDGLRGKSIHQHTPACTLFDSKSAEPAHTDKVWVDLPMKVVFRGVERTMTVRAYVCEDTLDG